MRKWLILLLIFMTQAYGVEILVLKNGKHFQVESYEIKGDKVLFKSETGQTLALPKSLVDFEKTKLATQAFRDKLAAEEKAYQAQLAEIEKAKRRKQRQMTMGEIAKEVEGTREGSAPVEVTLDSEKIQTFGENNPYEAPPRNSSSGTAGSEDDILSRRANDSSELPGLYQEAKGRLDQLVAQEERLQLDIERLENQMAFNDVAGAGEIYADLLDDKRTQLEQVRQEIQEKRDEVSQLERRARESGIHNFKNMKAQPKDDGNE
jgi:hypothetical protein